MKIGTTKGVRIIISTLLANLVVECLLLIFVYPRSFLYIALTLALLLIVALISMAIRSALWPEEEV